MTKMLPSGRLKQTRLRVTLRALTRTFDGQKVCCRSRAFVAETDEPMRVCVGVTEAQARLLLIEEDGLALAQGKLPLHDVTPSAMIVEMLDIEEQQ